MIRESDVVRPHVELPFPQPQDSAQHRSTVDPYSHVQIDLPTETIYKTTAFLFSQIRLHLRYLGGVSHVAYRFNHV